jgi:hypothetical protein
MRTNIFDDGSASPGESDHTSRLVNRTPPAISAMPA